MGVIFFAGNVVLPGNRVLFHATRGAHVKIGASKYSATGLTHGHYLIYSDGKKPDGTATLLDLSSLVELDDGFVQAGNAWHCIRTSNGGILDLSGLQRLIGPGDTEVLYIDAYSGGQIHLDNLKTITHAGNTGRVWFRAVGASQLELPALTSAEFTLFEVRDGATLRAAQSLSRYEATDLPNGSMYMNSHGSGSLLDLSSIVEINDAFSRVYNAHHVIKAERGGRIDLSGLQTLVGPLDNEILYIQSFDGQVDLSSLRTVARNSGSINFDVRQQGHLSLGSIESEAPMSFLLVDAAPVHVPSIITSETLTFDLRSKGWLSFDYLNAEAPVSAVLNRASTLQIHDLEMQTPLAVTLHDPNDLLEIGGDFVMGAHTTVTNPGDGMLALGGDLTYDYTDETQIPFDEGWICRGSGPTVDDPRNLIENGGFETGHNPPTEEEPVAVMGKGADHIDHWRVAQDTLNWTHESRYTDSGLGQRFADLGSETGNGAVCQTIRTVPGELYHVWFDLGVNPYAQLAEEDGEKQLLVSAAGQTETFSLDVMKQAGPAPVSGDSWPITWQKKTWRFTATAETTVLTFAGHEEPEASYGAAVDNVAVVPGDPSGFALQLSIKGHGSVTVLPSGSRVYDRFTQTYPQGQRVTLTAHDEHFEGWNGLTEDDMVDGTRSSSTITIRMSRNMVLRADFVDLLLQIKAVESDDCSSFQSTVLVKDINQEPLTNLNASHFAIFEDGISRDITGFSQGSRSVTFSLVLDDSKSMYLEPNDVNDLKKGAMAFVDNMSAGDRGEVIKFSSEIEVMQRFTDNPNLLKAAIQATPSFNPSRTQLYGAIHHAIFGLVEQPGCRAVVVFTDGKDNESIITPDEVIAYAQEANIQIFVVALRTRAEEAVLHRIAGEKGGLYYYTPESEHLEAIYHRIANTLNSQYVIHYNSAACGEAPSDSQHELEVRVDTGESYGSGVKSFTCSSVCKVGL